MKTCFSKHLGCSKDSPKREVHSDTGLPQKTRSLQYKKKKKVCNTQPNPTPKGAGKGIANKAYRRREK